MTQVEITLRRARAHVRSDRGELALQLLTKTAFGRLTLDQSLSVQMLTGAAYVRSGQKERGESILLEALGNANHARPLLRAELALQLGIAKYRLGAYDAADQLFASIGSNAAIVLAQALEYQGWVAHARGHFVIAEQRFREGLSVLSTCRRRDRHVEAKLLYGLTALCSELLMTQEWSVAERRLHRLNWSSGGLGRWRFWVDLAASMMCEATGDMTRARRWARHAQRSANGEGHRIVALCRLAAVFRGQGEVNAHADLVECARESYEALELQHLEASLQHLPLYLAEEIAHTSAPDDAEIFLTQYHELILPALKSSSGDLERYVAMERSIEGVLLEARGQIGKAVQSFAASYEVLAKLGYRRRATSVALRLARLTGERSYLAYAESSLQGTSSLFWMARELKSIQNGIRTNVTATEMAILRLVVHGKTYKEIAMTRRASVKTIDKHVQALFRKFNVHSRGELTAQAVQNGIVTLHAALLEPNGRRPR